jgi:hypothetical protein
LFSPLLAFATLGFNALPLFHLPLLYFVLTLLLGRTLLLLPGLVSLLDLLATLRTPNPSLPFLGLLRLCRNGRGPFGTTLRLLLLPLSLSLLLIFLSVRLPFLLFFLALLGSLLLSLFLLFATAPLSTGVGGKTDKTNAAYRYREPDSFNFFSFHGFPLYLKYPFARRDEAPERAVAIYIPHNLSA